MKKFTLLLVFVAYSFATNAQTTNNTGLTGDDLIFFEDTRFYREHPALPVSGYSVKITTGGTNVGNNGAFPASGTSAGESGYIRPANNYPAGDAIDMGSIRIQSNDGSANYEDDVWVVVESVDLSNYDGGSKYFTFNAQTLFREDGGTNIDDDNTIYYATNFATGTDPTDGEVTWTEIPKESLTNIGASAEMGADGVWTAHSIDLSSITCGTQFAIAIRRQTSTTGPTGGAFNSSSNRNGQFFVSGLAYTGTQIKTNVTDGEFTTFNTSESGQTNIFNSPTAAININNFTNTANFDNIFTSTNSVPRLQNNIETPAGEGIKIEVANNYNPIVITKLTYKVNNVTSSQSSTSDPSSWVFQGSNDDSTWDDLTENIRMFTTNATATINVNATQAYRYYRFVLTEAWTSTNDFSSVQELNFTVSALWQGTTDTDWSTNTNWNTNAVPTNEVVIPSGITNYPTITSETSVTLDNITIASGASLIAEGTSTLSGNVTYKRNLTFTSGNLEGWHLVAAPVAGQTFGGATTWLDDNDIASGSESNRGVATYNNAVASNNWNYSDGTASSFATGTGYSVKRGSAGDISFTGTINTTDVNAAVTTGTTGFNLIGNPYTAYINSATILTANTALLDSETIWIWNPSTKNYDSKVTGDNFKVAPGQGFFVKAASGGNVVIGEATQSHESDTFLKSNGSPEIILHMSDDNLNRYARIRYQDDSTLGFDNGYDGETFGGIPNSLDVFTNLVEDNQGKKYQVQSLPISEIENTIIPIGVKADAGKQLAFSLEIANFPSGVEVTIEDRATNTFTVLDNDGKYTFIPTDDLTETGRFYIHTSSKALTTGTEILNSVQIFNSNKNTIRIVGLQNGKTKVEVYNILGKRVTQESFTSNGAKDIVLPNVSNGMYIVKIQNEAGTISKKIILE